MFDAFKSQLPDADPGETAEWREALEQVVAADGPERARSLIRELLTRARELNVGLPALTQTPYVNTIPPAEEPPFPGDEGMEKRIRRIIRWNAMAMVYRANRRDHGLGGHIATYASSASLYEVGFNHFFRGKDAPGAGDQLFIQGHAAPGIYARAFLEGRLSEAQLDRFRRESTPGGLSSYPHPWLMPELWEFPTVSMGLGPLTAIYQARFNRYLHNRGLKDTSASRVWAFLGDGEVDEPEALGALGVAAREGLDNLIFVVNCNLQRLDGPVRGNGKIIQELEAVFRGAGWHVIKVVWGSEWDPLLARDVDGRLVARMGEVVDGQYQRYSVADGAYIRAHFFGTDPRLLALVADLSDDQIVKLRRGGHDYRKLYAAYRAASDHQNAPTVILAKTVKGWTLGEGTEGVNVAHQIKTLDTRRLQRFRDLLQLPIPDAVVEQVPYYHPGRDSPEVRYLLERRQALGGPAPRRLRRKPEIRPPAAAAFAELFEGSKAGVEASTTMAFVRLLKRLLKDPELGRRVVPIVPDEARTFGMEALFRDIGIYSALGQQYEPVDSHLFLNYHESKTGQLLEEGITEAGSMASFAAAGTSYATHGVTTIPFFIFYSMFGLQRIGDQAWACGDARARGFLLGATAGRTTLSGEGLQHEDGHSQLLANTIPTLVAYDPAYAYEVAVIIRDGLRRMLAEDEDVTYYLTLYNEPYVMPAMPAGVEDGILRGLYRLRPAAGGRARAQIFGSGPILRCALHAQEILAERFDVATDVWSATSYQQLFRDGRAARRRARLCPDERRVDPYLTTALRDHDGPVIAVSDYIEEVPSLVAPFVGRPFFTLGTNGFGRSDTREALRHHFEISAPWIAYTTLAALADTAGFPPARLLQARRELGLDPAKADPMRA
ncbi:MAG: pyruvate dehydrogenase (acetyl-transferring), homodimeric type [Deltaproteobacteria bacterium]|nr:pyruvate dehydrogenase (acetyl-transferring), homodimeric type [Deltaproteobacteria bacterium]